ncbi:MAG: hypothetical protein HYY43_03565 [Deltaproteobacteria bacterium]|nr:hypothetical protein [Deltaproteobacteria bacterium]
MVEFAIRTTEKGFEDICQKIQQIASDAFDIFDEQDLSAEKFQIDSLTYDVLPLLEKYSGKNIRGTYALFNAVYDAFDITAIDGEGDCDLPSGISEMTIRYQEDKGKKP